MLSASIPHHQKKKNFFHLLQTFNLGSSLPHFRHSPAYIVTLNSRPAVCASPSASVLFAASLSLLGSRSPFPHTPKKEKSSCVHKNRIRTRYCYSRSRRSTFCRLNDFVLIGRAYTWHFDSLISGISLIYFPEFRFSAFRHLVLVQRSASLRFPASRFSAFRRSVSRFVSPLSGILLS